MRHRTPFLYLVLILAAFFALAVTPAHAEETKRLVLKDGSYQSVVKYEVKGDRVRYLSAERYEWEEIPKELIDWDATKKFEDEMKAGVSHPADQVEKELAAEQKEVEEETAPEVAPGLRLPSTGGMYLLDVYRDQPQLVEMNQTSSDINRNTKGNILRSVIIPVPTSVKQNIELPGAHAKVQAHNPRPAIYINAEDNQGSEKTGDARPSDNKAAQVSADQFRIIKVQQKKDARVIGNLKLTVLTGKMSQSESFIPTRTEQLKGGWVKVTPTEDIFTGEYAVVEMLNPKEMNLYVWDFGVNPAAPQNPGAWTPDKPADKAPMEETPTLKKPDPKR